MAVFRFQAALSPAIVGANTTAEQLFTVGPGGYDIGNSAVAVSKPSAQAGIGICGARIASATQIGITFNNNTAGGITPTAGEVYQFAVTT